MAAYLETKLGSLDGSDVATGATADNNDIVWVSAGGETTALETGKSRDNSGRVEDWKALAGATDDRVRRPEIIVSRIRCGKVTRSSTDEQKTKPRS